jgi:hypothetical protein
MTDQENRGRRQFLLMALFFLGPLVLAFLVYYGFDWRPAGSTEHGEFLQPPTVLSDVALGEARQGVVPTFRRKWSLIIIEDEGCAATCQATLYETRQIRTALSRDNERTQRVLIIAGTFDRDILHVQHPDLIIVETDTDAARALAPKLDSVDRDFIYLADPLGNLMMRFPRDSGMKEIHTDLKKLLKLSRIG